MALHPGSISTHRVKGTDRVSDRRETQWVRRNGVARIASEIAGPDIRDDLGGRGDDADVVIDHAEVDCKGVADV